MPCGPVQDRISGFFIAASWLVLVSALALANSMTKHPGRDEQMYCTAGVLMARGMLPYRDFSYAAQLPYHPLILAGIYRLTGTSYYLLTARLFSVACDLLVVVLLVVSCWKIFGSKGLFTGLITATIYVVHPLISYANGYAWNHDLVQAAVMAGLLISLSTGNLPSPGFLHHLTTGVLLGVAVFSRVTTLLVLPVFAVGLVMESTGPLKLRLWRLMALLIGLIATAAWPLWVIMQAPGAFWLELVEIPRLYGQWLMQIGMTYRKSVLASQCLLLPENLLILALGLGSVVLLGKASLRYWMPLAISAAFCIVAFIPPTMWLQYWAIPIPFVLMWLTVPLHRLLCTRPIYRLLVLLVVATILARNWDVVIAVRSLGNPTEWVPIKTHRQYRQLLADLGPEDRVLTLGPLWALEGGCQIYRQLSCGPIIYRVADQLTEGQRRLTGVVGPGSIQDLVRVERPQAVLVGVEDPRFASLEGPLLSAVGPGWSSRSTDQGATLWFRPTRP